MSAAEVSGSAMLVPSTGRAITRIVRPGFSLNVWLCSFNGCPVYIPWCQPPAVFQGGAVQIDLVHSLLIMEFAGNAHAARQGQSSTAVLPGLVIVQLDR